MIKNKKSQMEIMGLAVVVILIIFGFAFMISFMVKEPVRKYQEDYSKAQMVENFPNTILKTTVITESANNCAGLSFSDMLVRCGTDTDCDSVDIGGASLMNSCAITKAAMEVILDKTIGEQKLKLSYHIAASQGGAVLYNDNFWIGDRCKGETKHKTYTIPTGTGTPIDLSLDICG